MISIDRDDLTAAIEAVEELAEEERRKLAAGQTGWTGRRDKFERLVERLKAARDADSQRPAVPKATE